LSRIDVKIDDAGDADEIEVIAVSVAEGDQVEAGQALIEVATDKADMDVEAPGAGRVAQVLVAVGDVVTVGQVLVVLEA
jgi:pyruvate/2-oxoglutarate dehydrogenase complex dihydrolipoamide acyltransferase (E2) component